MATAKFIIKVIANNMYKFNLKARNGQIIATSNVFESLEKCKEEIAYLKNVISNLPIEDQTEINCTMLPCPKFEIYFDKANQYRFRLKNAKNNIIALGEGYIAKAGCLKGIDSIKANVVPACLEEM